MRVALSPLPVWPYEVTDPRRQAQFKANGRYEGGKFSPGHRISYEQTLRDLAYEVEWLGGEDVLMGVGLTEFDVRKDGSPRANARPPAHPGVEISFDSIYGRLTYATDVFLDWRDNVRAIAKGLEALRAIDRWGVSKRGQQYAGFNMLTAGAPKSKFERGKELVEKYGSVAKALYAVHPDTGNAAVSSDDLQAVLAFRDGS